MPAALYADAPTTQEHADLMARVDALEQAGGGGGDSKAFLPYHLFDLSLGQEGYQTSVWNFMPNALSATLERIYFNYMRPISLAYGYLAWDPNSTPSLQTGVRYVAADDGPTNLVELARDVTTGAGFRTLRLDLTTPFQQYQQSGTFKNIGVQTIGHSTAGPRLYRATLEILWA